LGRGRWPRRLRSPADARLAVSHRLGRSPPTDLGIEDKVAIVIGASRGLGRACAEALAADGARIALAARSADTLARAADEIALKHGVQAVGIPCDVARPDDCRRLIEQTVARFGRIDILVTNTGGPSPGTFDTLDDAKFAAAFQSTLMNVVRLVREVLPFMKANRWGRIINITSISAKQPIDGLLLSNTIRPAVIGLAKSLSVELAPDNILVNNVCPGIHRTDRMEELVDTRAAGGKSREQVLAEMTAAIPLKRMGDPAELGALVAFLASQKASFITGATIAVDGGATRGLM